MNWNLILRAHLLETQRKSQLLENILTNFNQRTHKSLMELCNSNKISNPEQYLRAWILQGDEKYIDIKNPKEVIIYPLDDRCVVVLRFHAINNPEYTYKQQQIWKCAILTKNECVVRDAVSSLTHNVIVHRDYLRIDDLVIDKVQTNKQQWIPHCHNLGYLGIKDFRLIEYPDIINFGLMYPIHRSKRINMAIVKMILKILIVILITTIIVLYFQIPHRPYWSRKDYQQP